MDHQTLIYVNIAVKRILEQYHLSFCIQIMHKYPPSMSGLYVLDYKEF